MRPIRRLLLLAVCALALTGCNFFEFIQSAGLDADAGIDQYRTGCIIDDAALTRLYVQYDQMSLHFAGATPTHDRSDPMSKSSLVSSSSCGKLAARLVVVMPSGGSKLHCSNCKTRLVFCSNNLTNSR